MSNCEPSEDLSYLRDLNPAQREAVLHGLGPLLIFAGAGSGKTRVLTRRIAHIISSLGASPAQILAVTFTNKAAREMKQRVENLFPSRALPIWVATFHSTCARILRQHAKFLDFTQNFAIYDSSDSLSAMKRVYKKLNIDPRIIDPRTVLSQIDRAKNDYKFPEDIRTSFFLDREFTETIAALYEGYQKELHESNAMDFGDLIVNTVTLFKLETTLLESYQNRFRFLLVDEYQDTNKVQYLLIRQLTEKTQNICVVGDDDQSIYGFRGATVETILNFRKDFPEAHVVTLDINYRSTKNILSAANSLIAKNTRRQEKQMRTDNPQGEKIVGYRAFDEKDEAEFVSRELSSLLLQGVTADQVAIFYRTNAQSRAIEEALCEIGLPYQIFGGHRFYDRKEIKDLVAYLKLLVNLKDNEAFLRVINTPARGIGPTTIGALASLSEKNSCSLFEALQRAIESKELPLGKSGTAKCKAFLELILDLQIDLHTTNAILRDEQGNHSPSEITNALAYLLKGIAEKSRYLEYLKAQETLESEGRIENIDELCRVSIDFAERIYEQGGHPTIADFLDRASLSSDLDKENTGKSEDASQTIDTNTPANTPPRGHISLMTLHLAKGLEFDIVFMVGLEEGLLPHVRSLDDRQALEEERRLCYVGITRARKKLYLSRATDRQTFGRGNWYAGIPSRFLEDLPPQALEDNRSGFLS